MKCRLVPQPPVLLVEQHDAAPRVEPRLGAGVVQLQQRCQAGGLRLTGQQLGELARQFHPLAGRLAPLDGPAAGQVPLVENQVDHREHGR